MQEWVCGMRRWEGTHMRTSRREVGKPGVTEQGFLGHVRRCLGRTATLSREGC